jgi:predicted Zn-dependent peptidase
MTTTAATANAEPRMGARVTTLDNGMRVLTVGRPGDSMCTMLFVTAGSRYETRHNAGTAHMLEHLFFGGTRRRLSLRVIAAEIDSWGCRFNAMTEKEYTAYYVHGATEHTDRAVDLIADLIHNAVLPEADIERERGVVLAELRAREDNPRQLSRLLANRSLWGDQPMGWETVGFPDVIERLGRDDLMAFRQAMYRPERMILTVAGPVGHNHVVELAERHFGGTMGPAVAAGLDHPAPAPYAPPSNVASYRDSRLAHLWLTTPGPSYAQPEREMMAARLMNAVFGSSMSSRLFSSVREQQGLCYSIRSTLDVASDAGAFFVATSVLPDRAAELLRSVSTEMAGMAADGPTPEELRKARAIVKGVSVLEREDASALARLSAFELMQLGRVRTQAEIGALADSVTAAEVTAAARACMDPARLRCALVGPEGAGAALTGSGCLVSTEWTTV